MPIGNALQFGQAQHRVKVSGVSTYQSSDRGIYLQNGNDGIRIYAIAAQFVGIARQVDAVGACPGIWTGCPRRSIEDQG